MEEYTEFSAQVKAAKAIIMLSELIMVKTVVYTQMLIV